MKREFAIQIRLPDGGLSGYMVAVPAVIQPSRTPSFPNEACRTPFVAFLGQKRGNWSTVFTKSRTAEDIQAHNEVTKHRRHRIHDNCHFPDEQTHFFDEMKRAINTMDKERFRLMTAGVMNRMENPIKKPCWLNTFLCLELVSPDGKAWKWKQEYDFTDINMNPRHHGSNAKANAVILAQKVDEWVLDGCEFVEDEETEHIVLDTNEVAMEWRSRVTEKRRREREEERAAMQHRNPIEKPEIEDIVSRAFEKEYEQLRSPLEDDAVEAWNRIVTVCSKQFGIWEFSEDLEAFTQEHMMKMFNDARAEA